MKGKKLNLDFVGTFITDCAKNNKNTKQEILHEAKLQIAYLDEQIKKIEASKKLRSSLYDVLIAFDENKISIEDQELLPFFEVKNKIFARYICQKIQMGFAHLDDMKPIPIDTSTLTSMYNLHIITLHYNYVYRGESFDQFLSFLDKYYDKIK